jgi:hypothetical protein
MRLTLDGTKYYESLNSTEQDNFFSDLTSELSKILSIDPKRISSNMKTQVDNTISPDRQIFICIDIQSSKTERSVKYIIEDLKDMIENKQITSIGLFPTTKYIDEDFGFEPRREYILNFNLFNMLSFTNHSFFFIRKLLDSIQVENFGCFNNICSFSTSFLISA